MRALAIVVIIASINIANASERKKTIRIPYTCADVISLVSKFGQDEAERLAKQHGITSKQLWQAKRCLIKGDS